VFASSSRLWSTACGRTHNQTLQRTGRASRSSSLESASGARPAAERRSVMLRPGHEATDETTGETTGPPPARASGSCLSPAPLTCPPGRFALNPGKLREWLDEAGRDKATRRRAISRTRAAPVRDPMLPRPSLAALPNQAPPSRAEYRAERASFVRISCRAAGATSDND
jgi:hypothetical protein